MKNAWFTFVLLMAFSAFAQAQFQAGEVFLNGNFQLRFSNSDRGFLQGNITSVVLAGEVSSTDIDVMPRLGYLASSNLAIGLGLGYEGSFGETEEQPVIGPFTQTVKSTVHRYSFSPFLRYYKGFDERFGLWLDLYGSLGLGRGTFETVGNTGRGEVKEELFNMQLGIRPGLYYFLSRRFALEASVGGMGYSYNRRKQV